MTTIYNWIWDTPAHRQCNGNWNDFAKEQKAFMELPNNVEKYARNHNIPCHLTWDEYQALPPLLRIRFCGLSIFQHLQKVHHLPSLEDMVYSSRTKYDWVSSPPPSTISDMLEDKKKKEDTPPNETWRVVLTKPNPVLADKNLPIYPKAVVSEIIPGQLYLGASPYQEQIANEWGSDAYDHTNREFVIEALKSYAITDIFSLHQVEMKAPPYHNIHHHHFTLSDIDPDHHMDAYSFTVLTPIVLKLSQLLNSKKVVYVHCASGIFRYPLIVAAYLVLINEMSVHDAVEMIFRIRPCIWPAHFVYTILSNLISYKNSHNDQNGQNDIPKYRKLFENEQHEQNETFKKKWRLTNKDQYHDAINGNENRLSPSYSRVLNLWHSIVQSAIAQSAIAQGATSIDTWNNMVEDSLYFVLRGLQLISTWHYDEDSYRTVHIPITIDRLRMQCITAWEDNIKTCWSDDEDKKQKENKAEDEKQEEKNVPRKRRRTTSWTHRKRHVDSTKWKRNEKMIASVEILSSMSVEQVIHPDVLAVCSFNPLSYFDHFVLYHYVYKC